MLKILGEIHNVFGQAAGMAIGFVVTALICFGVITSFLMMVTSLVGAGYPFWGVAAGVAYGALVMSVASNFTKKV